MASTISSPDVPSTNGRLFYCHQCSHQWRKRENSDYVCPQCREGFIEDVEEGGYTQRAAGNSEDPIYSILHRIMSDASPGRPGLRVTSHRTAAGRSRSRSPRAQFFVHSNNRGRGLASGSPTHLNRAFQFDMDDLMSSFLSTRSQPVSQRTLQGIPTFTIAQEHTDTQCSICFDEFKLAEIDVRNLPCNHLFHERCIFPWLRINGTCPVCRARLAQADGDNANANANANEAAPNSSNFDNILRFMRLRRHARRHARTNEPTTSSSSQTEQPVVPPPTSSYRLRVPPVHRSASRPATPTGSSLSSSRLSQIETAVRRRANEISGLIRRERRMIRRTTEQDESAPNVLDNLFDTVLRRHQNNQEPPAPTVRRRRLLPITVPVLVPVIDLTASDSELSMLPRTPSRRVTRRHPLSSSSSSSSSSSGSGSGSDSSSNSNNSNAPLFMNDSSLSILSSGDSEDDTDFNALVQTTPRSPFLSSSDEE